MLSNIGLFPSIEQLEERTRCSLERFNYLSNNDALTIQGFFTALDNYEKNVRTSPISELVKGEWKSALSKANVNCSDEENEIVKSIQRDLKEGKVLKPQIKRNC